MQFAVAAAITIRAGMLFQFEITTVVIARRNSSDRGGARAQE